MLGQIVGYILFGAILYYFFGVFRAANRSIENWLNDKDLKLVSKELRLFRTGPFWATGNRPVYRVVVQLRDGQTKTCWVRCNSFLGFEPSYFEIQYE